MKSEIAKRIRSESEKKKDYSKRAGLLMLTREELSAVRDIAPKLKILLDDVRENRMMLFKNLKEECMSLVSILRGTNDDELLINFKINEAQGTELVYCSFKSHTEKDWEWVTFKPIENKELASYFKKLSEKMSDIYRSSVPAYYEGLTNTDLLVKEINEIGRGLETTASNFPYMLTQTDTSEFFNLIPHISKIYLNEKQFLDQYKEFTFLSEKVTNEYNEFLNKFKN